MTYGIQFFNSIFIAYYLGAFYLGIWGFILLVIQYLNQINFGVSHSVNTIASIHKHREKYISKIMGNAIFTISLLSFLFAIVFLCNFFFNLNFGKKYSFSSYSVYILVISIFTHYNGLFSNILRVYGRILELAINQSLMPFTSLVLLFFFKDEHLLNVLILAYLITTIVSFFLLLIRMPIEIKLNASFKLFKIINKKGWYLFVYNVSFYLILISTRTFVSYYYEINEFGFFTFAFSLANVLILLFDSFSFLVWPKLLNRFSKLNDNDSYKLIIYLRKIYITSTHSMLHIGIFIFPYFLLFFPEYKHTYTSFCLIALTIVLFTNSFGFQGLIIARGKEKLISKLSFLILLLNIAICFICIVLFKVTYDYVIISTLISYFIYIFMLNLIGRRILGLSLKINKIFNDTFPITLFIPFLSSLFLILLNIDSNYFIIPLGLFIFLNYRNIKKNIGIVKKIIFNAHFFEI